MIFTQDKNQSMIGKFNLKMCLFYSIFQHVNFNMYFHTSFHAKLSKSDVPHSPLHAILDQSCFKHSLCARGYYTMQNSCNSIRDVIPKLNTERKRIFQMSSGFWKPLRSLCYLYFLYSKILFHNGVQTESSQSTSSMERLQIYQTT